MSLKITSRETNGVLILKLEGRLVLGDPTRDVRETVKNAVASGKRKMIFDLGMVDYVDSSGLGTLVACYSSVSGAGGELKLLDLSKRVHEQLVMTKLLTVFENYEDEAQAVASFGTSAGA